MIRKKDQVVILAGKDRGKRGEVLEVLRRRMGGGDLEERILVAKINVVKRHARPTQTEPGGIREIEAPLPRANVMLVCPKCHQPTRPKVDFLADGKKTRVCRRCGEMIL